MNLAEKRQQDADYSGSSVPWRSPVSRISKPLLSKFITASSEDDAVEQARAVFKERPGDRIVTVEVVDLEPQTEDVATLPPDGDAWITS
jgi:hypothetical protein